MKHLWLPSSQLQWVLKEMDDGKTRYSSMMEDLDVAENLADEYRNYVASQDNHVRLNFGTKTQMERYLKVK